MNTASYEDNSSNSDSVPPLMDDSWPGLEMEPAEESTSEETAMMNDSLSSTSCVLEDNEYDNNSDDHTTIPSTTTTPKPPFGGLNNLGNTCYMNAALQMLASAQPFVQALESHLQQTAPQQQQQDVPSTLQTTLLDVLKRLQNGESSVRPETFKDAMDDRSPLFLGYLQQDSMEFLTTLLDLLDDDYKKKDAPQNPISQQQQQDATTTTEAVEEEQDEETADEVEQKEEEASDQSMETSSEFEQDATTDEETEDSFETKVLSHKKPRMEEPCRQTSFSEFDVDAISALLHATSEALILPEVSCTSIAAAPTYKLVGGRMPIQQNLQPLSEYAGVKPTPAVGPSDAAEEEPDEPETPEIRTPVSDHFTMTVRVRLTCDSCKYTRSHKETFLHLPLEIGTDCCYMEDGLRKFFAPCRQEIKCEKCFAESATQTMEILKLPNILLINFKRFIVDVSADYSSVSYRKDGSSVYFDEEVGLDPDMGVFSECLAPECEATGTNSYTLTSVVNHIGSSASCGHYTADALREDQWYRFNDSFVESIPISSVVQESRQTAYMVLYQLK